MVVNLFGLRWSRKEIVIIVAVVMAVTPLFFYLSYISYQKFGAAYPISWAALIIATVAAFGTLISLKWTRDTVRPFLTLTEGKILDSKGGQVIKLTIRNTGALPADDVKIDFNLRSLGNEESSGSILDEERFTCKVIFPNQEMETQSTKLVPDLRELIKAKKIKVRITMKYKSIQKECITIRVAEMAQSPESGKILLLPISDEEYWD